MISDGSDGYRYIFGLPTPRSTNFSISKSGVIRCLSDVSGIHLSPSNFRMPSTVVRGLCGGRDPEVDWCAARHGDKVDLLPNLKVVK